MHERNLKMAGVPLGQATKAVIMIHGRGGNSEDILSLSHSLNVEGYALLAPQATNHSWYPQSFLARTNYNEPWLSSALQLLKDAVQEVTASGIKTENIFFAGFSQGACLTLEFIARNPSKYGGVAAFTGGLIGDKLFVKNYIGDLAGTVVYIGSSDPDMHVPVERVNETVTILSGMGAAVTKRIFKNMGHTITSKELKEVNELLFNL